MEAGYTRSEFTDKAIRMTKLRGCLMTLDLILIGLSYIIGMGLIAHTDHKSHYHFGYPATIWFIIVGITLVWRVLNSPDLSSFWSITGSSHAHSDPVIGEVWAFIVD